MKIEITGGLLEKVVKKLNARDLEELIKEVTYCSTVEEAEKMGVLDQVIDNKIKHLIEKGIETADKEEAILELYDQVVRNQTLEELLKNIKDKTGMEKICVNFKRDKIIYYKINTAKKLLEELSKKEKDSKVYLDDTHLPFSEITVFLDIKDEILI